MAGHAPEVNTTLSYAYGYQRPMRYFGTPLIDGEQDKSLHKQNYNVSKKIGGLDNTTSVGFDVNHASFKHINNTYAGSSGSVDLYHPNHGYYQSDAPFIPRYRNKVDQFALFMEDRLALTDKWSVIGGLRYDHAKVTRDDLVTNQRTMSQTFSDVGWRVGTVYDITPDAAVYAQYAEAADPVSDLLMISPVNADFDLARGKQIEVGVKQAFMDNRGQLTLAAYHIRKSNLLSRDATNPSLRVQVGEQSSRGVEASLSMAFAPRWTIEAKYTTTDLALR